MNVVREDYDEDLGGEAEIDLELGEAFEYDLDDQGDGTVVIQFWRADR